MRRTTGTVLIGTTALTRVQATPKAYRLAIVSPATPVEEMSEASRGLTVPSSLLARADEVIE
jgi:hypothetical protein